MATFVKTYLSIPVHKIGAMHTSSTINMHQRFKNLFLNGAYTNCQGSWNLVGRLNHNWLNPVQRGYICLLDQNQQIYKNWIIHSQYLVMEAVVIQCDILNHSRYQFHITIPPRESTVVSKLIMMWTINNSLTDQNQQIYKNWDHS